MNDKDAGDPFDTYLDLIGYYSPGTQVGAYFVGPDCVEIAEADCGNQAFSLQISQMIEGLEIGLVLIVLPVKLSPGFMRMDKCEQTEWLLDATARLYLPRGTSLEDHTSSCRTLVGRAAGGTLDDPVVDRRFTHLKKVDSFRLHPFHPLTYTRFDDRPGDVGGSKDTPFCGPEDGIG